VNLSEFSRAQAFQKRVAERPAVRKALIEEGLIKEQDPGIAEVG
jgi:hypothetical protein